MWIRGLIYFYNPKSSFLQPSPSERKESYFLKKTRKELYFYGLQGWIEDVWLSITLVLLFSSFFSYWVYFSYTTCFRQTWNETHLLRNVFFLIHYYCIAVLLLILICSPLLSSLTQYQLVSFSFLWYSFEIEWKIQYCPLPV